MMKYLVEFRYDDDKKEHTICNETALKFKEVKWEYEEKHYNFIYDDAKPYTGFFGDDFILILYLEDSLNFPSPNNLVLYNLKKEIIKVIPPPAPKQGGSMPITSMGSTEIIDGVKHISVRIDNIGNSWTGNVEIHYLNSETFEYHPTAIKTFFEYGR